jgi:hypothetical protein
MSPAEEISPDVVDGVQYAHWQRDLGIGEDQ